MTKEQGMELAALKEWVTNGSHCHPCFSSHRTRQVIWDNLTEEEKDKILEKQVKCTISIDHLMR